ncbi:MAG: peptidase domain-containing ABC transporter [Sphingobacterium sp.]
MFNKINFEPQLDIMDCGPACIKMISKYYGKYFSIQYLRDVCGISKEGISIKGLSYCSERIGFKTLATKCSINDLIHKVPLPAILHIEEGHFVVVYRAVKRKNRSIFHIADPSKGYLRFKETELTSKWVKNGKGTIILFEPQADFNIRDEEGKVDHRKRMEKLMGFFSPYKKSFLHLGFVMLIITGLQAFLPFISKAVIDVGIQTQDLTFINIVLIANLTLIISITLSSAVRDWILQHISSRINIALISDYLIKLMKLPTSFFENKMLGDILQRANDHERIRSFIMNNSLNLVFSILTFIIFGIILFIFDVTIFYIFSAGCILYISWVLVFFKIRKKLDWDYFDLTAQNQSYWVETINAIQDIKINNFEQKRRWKWEHIQAKLFKVNMKLLSVNNVQNLGAGFIDSTKNLLITFYCAKAVIGGEITFGIMISTQFIIGMLNGPVQQLISFIISFQFAHISFLRLNEIQSVKDEDEDCGNNDLDLTAERNIRLSNVSFQYTHVSPVILKNITLTIPHGKITAIVGSSGSGKTTLLKLLTRTHRPSFGDILVGNLNLNNIGLRQWRDKCGVVLQDGKLFNDTVLNNIILDEENFDMQRLKTAVSTANISYDIEQLPLGYKTKLGENGRSLSGGQKQRILIARALYRDPDILFFDEATNSLDTLNEQKITSALDEVFSGKTVVVVAHRLSTIKKADQIVVLNNGYISEIGDHDFLLAKNGLYTQLVQSQSEVKSIA